MYCMYVWVCQGRGSAPFFTAIFRQRRLNGVVCHFSLLRHPHTYTLEWTYIRFSVTPIQYILTHVRYAYIVTDRHRHAYLQACVHT